MSGNGLLLISVINLHSIFNNHKQTYDCYYFLEWHLIDNDGVYGKRGFTGNYDDLSINVRAGI
jgi:hypothetical protein